MFINKTALQNAYTPGENGEDKVMEVKCDGPKGQDFDITIFDADDLNVNKEVRVQIVRENSTVENLGDGINETSIYTTLCKLELWFEYSFLSPPSSFPLS